MALKDYEKSKDGIEMQLAANHTGHFLLTNLLMPKLLAAQGARIVNVSSFGYMSGGIYFDDPNFKVSGHLPASSSALLFSLSKSSRGRNS